MRGVKLAASPELTDATDSVDEVTPVSKVTPVAKDTSAWKELTPLNQRQAPKRRRLVRFLKILAAVVILGVGVGTILADHGRVSSDNAVVSAYLISLRTPIEGTVSGLPGGIGTTVSRSQLIARVDNPRVDDQRLVDLREQLSRVQAQRTAVETNRVALRSLRAELLRRVESHTKANSGRLAALVAEAEESLSALAAKQAQAQAELDRRIPLEASAIVGNAEMQRLRSSLETARYDTAAQVDRLAAIRVEAAASAQGVLSGHGGVDVTYSAQRADEVAISLANLDQTVATLDAQVAETESRLRSEESRISLLRAADLTSPSAGIIWKLGAVDGERLGIGDQAAEIVDCSAAFLLVAIPQDRFSDVEIGSLAKFRLSGERNDRTGTVLSVTAQGDLLAKGAHFAATPVAGSSTVIVAVAMSPSANVAGDCLVGRTARVVLPSSGGLVERVIRRIV